MQKLPMPEAEQRRIAAIELALHKLPKCNSQAWKYEKNLPNRQTLDMLAQDRPPLAEAENSEKIATALTASLLAAYPSRMISSDAGFVAALSALWSEQIPEVCALAIKRIPREVPAMRLDVAACQKVIDDCRKIYHDVKSRAILARDEWRRREALRDPPPENDDRARIPPELIAKIEGMETWQRRALHARINRVMVQAGKGELSDIFINHPGFLAFLVNRYNVPLAAEESEMRETAATDA